MNGHWIGALDRGAGEHLASREALVHQGIPQSVIEECEATCSSKPLTFSTGGGLKEADVTIKTQGDLLGDGIVYMLRKCPFVKSLGQLVQSGFSFFWGPNHEPTLVPPTMGFDVNCDFSKCVVADRVEHCVPIFKEEVSFVHGVPAAAPSAFDAGDGEGVSRVEDTEPASEAVGSLLKLLMEILLSVSSNPFHMIVKHQTLRLKHPRVSKTLKFTHRLS